MMTLSTLRLPTLSSKTLGHVKTLLNMLSTILLTPIPHHPNTIEVRKTGMGLSSPFFLPSRVPSGIP